MQISAEWVAAMTSVALAAGGAMGWLARERKAARDATPIVRTEWIIDGDQCRVRLEFVNRINEDLTISHFQASGPLFQEQLIFDDGGSIVGANYAPLASPSDFSVGVPALGASRCELVIGGPGHLPKYIRITVSSSNRTLSKRRMLMKMRKAN